MELLVLLEVIKVGNVALIVEFDMFSNHDFSDDTTSPTRNLFLEKLKRCPMRWKSWPCPVNRGEYERNIRNRSDDEK